MEKWKQKSGVDFSPTSSTRKAGILAISLYPVLYTHPIMKALCETTLLCLAPEWIDCVSLIAELMGFIAVSSYSGIPFNPCSLSLWRSGLYMPHEPRLVSWMLYGYEKKKKTTGNMRSEITFWRCRCEEPSKRSGKSHVLERRQKYQPFRLAFTQPISSEIITCCWPPGSSETHCFSPYSLFFLPQWGDSVTPSVAHKWH